MAPYSLSGHRPARFSSERAPASSRAYSLASACRPARGLRSGSTLRAASSSCGKFLVRDATAHGRRYEAVEPFQCMSLAVGIVQPKGELVDVAAKVLRASVMVNAVQAALENGPHASRRRCKTNHALF